MHHSSQVIRIFNQCFKHDLQTELVRGADEPIYLPRTQYYPWDRVIFAHGYFASALHEISHWCIAGDERRRLVDFGYWYNPDGRSASEQLAFEQVEVKPQALEWILAKSADFSFNISLDNLNGEASDPARTEQFKDNIWQQVQLYFQQGLPQRAKTFSDALISQYRRQHPLRVTEFKREEL